MRKTNAPFSCRAKSQLNSAVRAFPTWTWPVGLGANRTRTLDITARQLFITYPTAAPARRVHSPRQWSTSSRVIIFSFYQRLSTLWIADGQTTEGRRTHGSRLDRKSTRLNSSHITISYAVFCLKKKK